MFKNPGDEEWVICRLDEHGCYVEIDGYHSLDAALAVCKWKNSQAEHLMVQSETGPVGLPPYVVCKHADICDLANPPK